MKNKAITLVLFCLATYWVQAQPAYIAYDLISLEVTLSESTPVLRWSSKSEINTSYYIVERQNIKGDYEIIGTLASKANNQFAESNYEFEDLYIETIQPPSYRITLVWMDGTRLTWNL